MSTLINIPILYVYETTSTSETFTLNVPLKIKRQNVKWDSCGWWDSGKELYRPQVPGVYEVYSVQFWLTVANAVLTTDIYKNGTQFRSANHSPGASPNSCSVVHTLIQMNGSTDYIEFYSTSTVTTTQTNASNSSNYSWITLIDPWIDLNSGPVTNRVVQNIV